MSKFSINAFVKEGKQIKEEQMDSILGGVNGEYKEPIAVYSTNAAQDADGNSDCLDIYEGSKPGTVTHEIYT